MSHRFATSIDLVERARREWGEANLWAEVEDWGSATHHGSMAWALMKSLVGKLMTFGEVEMEMGKVEGFYALADLTDNTLKLINNELRRWKLWRNQLDNPSEKPIFKADAKQLTLPGFGRVTNVPSIPNNHGRASLLLDGASLDA